MKDQISPEGKQFSSADFADSSIEEGTLLVTAADDQKRRRKLLILLILTLLSSAVVAGRYARYTTSSSANDAARVAGFVLSLKNGANSKKRFPYKIK